MKFLVIFERNLKNREFCSKFVKNLNLGPKKRRKMAVFNRVVEGRLQKVDFRNTGDRIASFKMPSQKSRFESRGDKNRVSKLALQNLEFRNRGDKIRVSKTGLQNWQFRIRGCKNRVSKLPSPN